MDRGVILLLLRRTRVPHPNVRVHRRLVPHGLAQVRIVRGVRVFADVPDIANGRVLDPRLHRFGGS